MLFFIVGCYPFQEHDPFLLKTTPHVYFVGNQQQFEQSVVEGKRKVLQSDIIENIKTDI